METERGAASREIQEESSSIPGPGAAPQSKALVKEGLFKQQKASNSHASGPKHVSLFRTGEFFPLQVLMNIRFGEHYEDNDEYIGDDDDDRDEAYIPNAMPRELYEIGLRGDTGAFTNYPGDVNIINSIGRNILHMATERGHRELVKHVARHFPQQLKVKDRFGNTPLHLAAERGDQNIVIDLLQHQSSDVLKEVLIITNRRDNTPLHVALMNGHENVADYLLTMVKDSDVHVQYGLNKEKKTPLYIAAKNGYETFVQKYFGYAKEVDKSMPHVVYAAIASRSPGTLKSIISKIPLPPTLQNQHGRTPLSVASASGFVIGVEQLLGSSSARHLCDSDGDYPIHRAARKGHQAVVQAILRVHPESIYHLDREERTFLHVAAEEGKESVVSYSLSIPDIPTILHMQDKNGNTILHAAASAWHPDIVRMLTEDRRVTINMVNREKLTALDLTEVRFSRKREPLLREILTWEALCLAKVPRRRDAHQSEPFEIPFESIAGRLGAMSALAVLVGGVSYSYVFTVPGGFQSEGENIGVAIFDGQPQFIIFNLSNMFALLSSVVSLILLVFCYKNDSTLYAPFARYSGLGLTLGSISLLVAVLAGTPLYTRISSVAWIMRVACLMVIILLLLVHIVLFYPDPLANGPLAKWLGKMSFKLKLRWYKFCKRQPNNFFKNNWIG